MLYTKSKIFLITHILLSVHILFTFYSKYRLMSGAEDCVRHGISASCHMRRLHPFSNSCYVFITTSTSLVTWWQWYLRNNVMSLIIVNCYDIIPLQTNQQFNWYKICRRIKRWRLQGAIITKCGYGIVRTVIISLSVCMSVCLSDCLFVCLFVCLSRFLLYILFVCVSNEWLRGGLGSWPLVVMWQQWPRVYLSPKQYDLVSNGENAVQLGR